MSYVKKEWKIKDFQKGDKVFVEGLNHMEEGIEQGGGGGEPAQYLKDASVANEKLTLTKKDGSAVEFDVSGKQAKLIADTGIEITADNKIKTTSDGKNWYQVELSQSDIKKLSAGYDLTYTFETEYDATSFKNDYFLCTIDEQAEKDGTMVFDGDAFSHVYVYADGIKAFLPYVIKVIGSLIQSNGFDHNYYKTIVLYAGCAEPGEGEKPILSGAGVLDGKNVIYVQDTTQQPWEFNAGEKTTSKREQLESQNYDGTYVVSINGNTGICTFMIALQEKQQAPYWDTTANAVRWANLEEGELYTVTFDGTGAGQHGTYRWLLSATKEEEEEIWGDPMTSQEKTKLLDTGIGFEADKVTAIALEDTSMKLGTECFGVGEKYLSRVFSFNSKFKDQGEAVYVEYIGRPTAYMIDTYTWYEYDELGTATKHIEKDGEHVWTSNIDGTAVKLVVPANYDESGVPHRTKYIISMDAEDSTTTKTLYRHTFNINNQLDAETGAPIAVEVAGQKWVINIAFSAVNAQAGDSSIDYILFSDESGQWDNPDWILPVSGVLATCDATGVPSTFYTPTRIAATYTNIGTEEEPNYIRCLRISYLDNATLKRLSVDLIRADNCYSFVGTDFRSTIADVICEDNDSYAELKAVTDDEAVALEAKALKAE